MGNEVHFVVSQGRGTLIEQGVLGTTNCGLGQLLDRYPPNSGYTIMIGEE